jgi:hypothetical protein
VLCQCLSKLSPPIHEFPIRAPFLQYSEPMSLRRNLDLNVDRTMSLQGLIETPNRQPPITPDIIPIIFCVTCKRLGQTVASQTLRWDIPAAADGADGSRRGNTSAGLDTQKTDQSCWATTNRDDCSLHLRSSRRGTERELCGGNCRTYKCEAVVLTTFGKGMEARVV